MIKEFACIMSDDAQHLETIRMKRNSLKFSYDNKAYNISRKGKNYLYFVKYLLFWRIERRYYIYNVHNPDQLELSVNNTPIFNAEQYNIMLETKALSDLNKIGNSFLGNIDWKVIVIGLAILAAIIFFIKGGKIA